MRFILTAVIIFGYQYSNNEFQVRSASWVTIHSESGLHHGTLFSDIIYIYWQLQH